LRPPFVLIKVYFSTGRRRYDHPALNGVLPEPWLPLKKGQTLTNNENGNHRRSPKDSGDQAVVLTLRKRYSIGPRRSVRRPSQDSRREGGSTSTAGVLRLEEPDDSTTVDPTAINNPWEDARPGTTTTPRRSYRHHAPPLRHRLSYDHASGVIMLPEDGNWLQQADDDDSDDEQNYEGTTTNGLETESIHNEETSVVDAPSSPSRPSRYGTYFHHPERAAARRRQSIPGAFSPSS
jgi:calcium permeable stress-gated cation channel